MDNLVDDEVVSYPLVLLEGRVIGLPCDGVFLDAGLDDLRHSLWPVTAGGRFKALILLPSPGKFAITLSAAGIERVFFLEYRPPVTRYVVKFYYQICADSTAHDGFDAPPGVDNSDAVAIAKVRFNALLLQMATAELLHDAGLPRQTFAMQFAADGLPEVTLLRTSFTNAHARSVDGQELIKLVREDIEASGMDDHPELDFKHAVVLGCSRYNTQTQKAEGHTALGGGKVGVFGSCGLHTWPSHLGEVTACCLNNTRIDKRVLLDDSCYRGTFWANFSTGIGATLHEIGHTFGLGHATSGIMSRGFDDMNRLLCVYQADPRSGRPGFHQASPQGWLELNHAALHEVDSRGGAHWNAGSAHLVRHCPWISGFAKPSLVGPTVSWDDSVRGPVGHGQYNGTQVPLPEERSPSSSEGDELGAVMLDAGKYIDRLETLTRDQLRGRSDPLRASGNQHWFVLAAGEYVTQVDVRAMAWIDGLQLHTNLRSSKWYGGTGGTLYALKAADGWRVQSFFGTRGDSHVGKLGLRCLPVTSPPPVPRPLQAEINAVSTSSRAGKALEGGPKTPFSTSLPVIGAVVIRCGRFTESIAILSPAETTAKCQDPRAFRSNEHVFVLVPGENLVKLEVSSGHWVDCVQLTTTSRESPWFGGGRGPDFAVMECPPHHHICGFHGVQGKKYVGAVGMLYAPETPSCLGVQAREASNTLVETREFRLMRTIPLSNEASHQTPAPPLGLLVAVQDGSVVSVLSFESARVYDESVNQLHLSLLTVGKAYQVHCFPLKPNERVVQIDVSLRPAGPTDSFTVIDGVCFHTTARCSSWFGNYHESNVRFFMAPEETSILDIRGEYTGSVLDDLCGLVGRPDHAQLGAFAPDARVLTDAGTYDVRLETASPAFGVECALLLKKDNGDGLDHHAWPWNQPGMPCPRVWRLPQRMLEARVESPENMVRKYMVGAIDTGGAHAMPSSCASLGEKR